MESMRHGGWKRCLPYLWFILLALAVGGLSSIAVQVGLPAYERLEKPPFTPPHTLLPIVWGVLYTLMGVGMAMVWRKGGRGAALAVFCVQLVWNALWPLWFFALGARLVALLWLLALVVLVAWMLRLFVRVSRPAAWLQMPYLVWTAFALLLNLLIWLLNR